PSRPRARTAQLPLLQPVMEPANEQNRYYHIASRRRRFFYSDARLPAANRSHRCDLCHAGSTSGGRAGFSTGSLNGGVNDRVSLFSADPPCRRTVGLSYASASAYIVPACLEHCFKSAHPFARF